MELPTIYEVDIMNYNAITLTLRIEFNGNDILMKIPLPENYPLTDVGISEDVKLQGLFFAGLSIKSPEDRSWHAYLLTYAEKLFNVNAMAAILLGEFHSIPIMYEINTTHEEKLMLSGLGKRFLCIGFQHIINHYNLYIDDTLVAVQASGGEIRNDLDRLRVQKYMSLNKNNILDIYQIKYPNEFSNKFVYLKENIEEIAEQLVKLENNEKLIKYYNNSYGFQALTYTSRSTLMSTVLSIFLYNCSN